MADLITQVSDLIAVGLVVLQFGVFADLASIGLTVVKAAMAMAMCLVNVLIFLYAERKFLADLQIRMGPMRVGPHGLLQPLADGIKLALKEDIIPASVDWLMFVVAPIVAFAPSFMLYLVIPLSETFAASQFDLGLFYMFATLTVVPVGLLMAGWASYSKFSLLGGLRAAAQQVSYEIPLLASMLGVVMIAGSFGLVDIVKSQDGFFHLFGLPIIPRWNIFVQPFGFLFFFIAALADTQRTPFDMPEAESELVQGFATEYSSMRFAVFFLGEYSNVLVASALCTIAFFGGWAGPVLPGFVWFFLKTYFFVFLIIWLRATLPRLRIDQLMDLGWKVLLPLTLANVLVTGLLQLFVIGG